MNAADVIVLTVCFTCVAISLWAKKKQTQVPPKFKIPSYEKLCETFEEFCDYSNDGCDKCCYCTDHSTGKHCRERYIYDVLTFSRDIRDDFRVPPDTTPELREQDWNEYVAERCPFCKRT